MPTDRKNYARLVALLVANAKPHKDTLHKSTNVVRNALDDADKIIRAGNTIVRWSVLQCNGIERWDEKARQRLSTWTEEDQARCDKAIEKAGKAIAAVLADYRLSKDACHARGWSINRDPRGSAVRISFRDHESWHH